LSIPMEFKYYKIFFTLPSTQPILLLYCICVRLYVSAITWSSSGR
jgi:hypothetical protein